MMYRQRHARVLAGASGLQCRVWIHYAACGDGRTQGNACDTQLAMALGCTRPSLVKARKWLVEESLLCSYGHRFTIPEWIA